MQRERNSFTKKISLSRQLSSRTTTIHLFVTCLSIISRIIVLYWLDSWMLIELTEQDYSDRRVTCLPIFTAIVTHTWMNPRWNCCVKLERGAISSNKYNSVITFGTKRLDLAIYEKMISSQPDLMNQIGSFTLRLVLYSNFDTNVKQMVCSLE